MALAWVQCVSLAGLAPAQPACYHGLPPGDGGSDENEMPSFYVFAIDEERSDQSPSTVFYRVDGESTAGSLCTLFESQYGSGVSHSSFRHKAAGSFSVEEQVLLDESIDLLGCYRDPDPGIYDPQPSSSVFLRAQYAVRAEGWEALLRGATGDGQSRGMDGAVGENSPLPETPPGMPTRELGNRGVILLMLLAQAYYLMLENVISMASWCTTLDLELNQSYLWVVTTIGKLLEHEELRDFPTSFEPILPDLYPSTIGDIDWEEIAGDVEGFLIAVQRYAESKRAYEPEKGSQEWIFVQLFRPGINSAIERAIAYNKSVRQHMDQLLSPAPQRSVEMVSNPVLADFPNPDSNVFLMMRFRETPQHAEISEVIRSTLSEYSLNAIRADSKHYHDELWANVKSCMDASTYGIVIFEQIDERDVNPNVSLELGYMIALGKKCLLLKEKRVQALQTDLVGRLYRVFDSYNIAETVQREVQKWLADDLGIAKRSNERLLVYVSSGGTCRDPMAKAITQKLLKERFPGYNLRVEAAAIGPPNKTGASEGAREAIRELYGEDLLAGHVPKAVTPRLAADADLILVMDHGLLNKTLPSEKTHVLKPFLGLEGDVLDPWPDDQTKDAAVRYTNCAAELKEIIGKNIDKIVTALQPPTA